MKRIWRRALVVLMAVLIMLSAAFICTAESTAQFSFSPVSFDKTSGKYIKTDTFGVDDTLFLEVSITGIDDRLVRGNAFVIDYDESILTFLSDSSICTVSDKNALFSAVDSNGKVLMNWDTTSKDTVFSGAIYYFKFKVNDEIKQDATASFKLEVTDLYASLNGFPDIPFTVNGDTKSATVTTQTISDDILALFDKLENITTNSLDDIVAGLNAYNNDLTSVQKKYLKSNYPEKYNWLSTAYDRYYAAVSKANEDEVNAIIKDFNDTYSQLLAKDLSKVTLADADKVAALDTAYKALPALITSRLGKGTKEKIAALTDWIETLTDANAEAKYFREAYSKYYNLTDAEIESGYTNFSTVVAEALMIYDSYNDTTKSLLSKEYKLLSAVNDKMQALIAQDAELAALNEKVNAFQKKWLRCFTLNPFNVSVGDKTALEMAIADYETLEDDVKEKLAAKIAVFKNLLTVIEKLEAESGEVETILVPGETVTEIIEKEVVKTETVEVPKETVVTVPGEQTVITTPGQTVTVEKEVIKTETVEVPAENTQANVSVNQGFTKSIYILLILLAITLLLALLPLILQLRYNKLLALAGENSADDDFGAAIEKEENYE